MKKYFSKAIALLLSLVIVFGCASAVSAADFGTAEGKCSCEHCPSIVIPGLFQSKVRYLDENGNEKLNSEGKPYAGPFFMEGTTDIVFKAVEKALIPLASLLISQQDKEERAAKAIAEVLGDALLGNLALDTNGNNIKNIQADKYLTSLAGLTEEQREYALDQIPLDLYAEIAGMDHLYFYSFLSTGNMLKTVEGLYELIQIAKKETGHDKVNLVPISQGGSVENALMQYYLDNGLDFAADVNRVCYVVPAADGAYTIGDVYHYGFIDDADALYDYMLPSLLGEDDFLGYLINIILRIFPNADLNNILDKAVDVLVNDYLAYSTNIWALIPSRDYPDCREKYLSDPEDEVIREQTDWYYNAQVNSRNYILDLQKKGIEFFDIVDYNCSDYRIFDSWKTENGDGVIHLDSTSFGATSVAVDKALPNDYVQANTYCTDPSHNHIDEERLVDASTGILCETTFYFKDQAHVSTASNDVIMRLAIRILTDPDFKDIYSDPGYPQFNFARNSVGVIYRFNLWKNYDVSKLSAEDAAEFIAARDELAIAIESTCMPTEEFDAAADRFDKCIEKITAPESDSEEEENEEALSGDFFKDLLTKIFRFLSKLFFNIFGDKGFSDK
ncbi:MAG: hypothetical protein UHM85_04425 [Acutalibacteraceae bacterium]|nr:hypothetical protein [Acutalibacteraceae bacterium]